ncbi:MAG: hypothetical protein ABIO44_02705 [Saprospiraceae bacterium]
MNYKLHFVFLLLSLSHLGIRAQFNFQVGYAYSWSEFSKLNEIINNYNKLHPEFSKKMGSLNGLHGIILGLRYQYPHIALTGSWSNQINNKYSLSPPAGTSTVEIKQELFYKNQIFSLGLESVTGMVSVGSTIDFRIFGIKGRHDFDEGKYNIMQVQEFGSNFYTQLDFPVSHRMALLLRLNYCFPWNGIDLTALDKSLNPLSSPSIKNEKFNQFGISLIFSNGFQERY